MSTVISIYILDTTSLKNCEPYLFSRLKDTDKAFYLSKTDKRRAQYVFSRLLLRYALSRPSDKAIDLVDVVERTSAKPDSIFANNNNLQYSLSHSCDVYAVAVVCSLDKQVGACHIGVDIEQLEPLKNELSASFFCNKKQLDEFHRLKNKKDKERYYYRVWTQKEACLKAMGENLFSESLKKIDFNSSSSSFPFAYTVKTVLLEKKPFDKSCQLSACSNDVFNWQLFKVFMDHSSFNLSHEKIMLDSASFFN